MDGSVMGGAEIMARAFQMGAQWEDVDLIIGNSSAIWFLDYPKGTKQHALNLKFLIDLAHEVQKPMAIVINSGDPTTPFRVEAILEAQESCRTAGIPVYPNITRAARALSRFTEYYRRIQPRL